MSKSKSQIKFIRAYNVGNSQFIDIIYDPLRIRTCLFDAAPKTALNFIDNASRKRTEWDILMKRLTVIYE